MEMSRRNALLALPAAAIAAGAAPAGAAYAEDPIIPLYRRYVDALAEAERLQRPATRFFTAFGVMSKEFRQAAIPAGEAWEREKAIRNELLATPATSPAGLLLLSHVVRSDNLIASIRRLHPADELEPAERMIAYYDRVVT